MVLMKDGKSKKCVGKMMEGIRKGKRKYEGRKQINEWICKWEIGKE